MICKKCGNKLSDNAKFCNKCGSKMSSYPETAQVTTYGDSLALKNSGDSFPLNRQALIIYLKNLCVAETIVHESKKAIVKLTTELLELDSRIQKLKSKIENYPTVEMEEANTNEESGCIIILAIFATFSLGGMIVDCASSLGMAVIGVIIIGIGSFFLINSFFLNRNKKKMEKRYKERCEEREQIVNELSIELKKLQDEYDRKQPIITNENHKLREQFMKMEEILNFSYGLNIIPFSSNPKNSLRTIEGVFYLYEFVESSRESFTTAIYNYKLDLIASRLDSLISKMNSAIRNQHAIMRQNDYILEEIKNNAMMTRESLQNIEDYTNIAAQNSAIQTELAKDALFYQKVKFITDL